MESPFSDLIVRKIAEINGKVYKYTLENSATLKEIIGR